MAAAHPRPRTLNRFSYSLTDQPAVSTFRSALVLTVVASASWLAACRESSPPAPPPPRPIMDGTTLRFPAGHPQLAALSTQRAEPSRPQTVEMPARVIWDEDHTQRIYPAFSGRVTDIRADIGTRVIAGQMLVELASPEFGIAQAETRRAVAEVSHAQRQLDRVRDLHAIGIAARKELEQAENDMVRVRTELERAQARTRLYGSTDQINQRLTVTAGMAGVVVERNLNPGQELRPDQFGPSATALFVLTDPSRLWLQIDVREGDLALIESGRKIEFAAHAYPDRWFPAEVTAVGDAINPITHTLKARARVDNSARLLKVEMLGKIRVSHSPGDGVVTPAAAVFIQEGGHWVYVAPRPGEFQPRKVDIVYLGTQRVLVRNGLAPGEQVLTENALLLSKIYRSAADASERSSPAGRSTSP